MVNRILNISICSTTLNALLENLEKGVVVTPNVDHLIKLQHDREFYNAYQKADWVICDSKIVNLAAKFLGQPFKEVIPGSTLFPAFYHYHKNNTSVNIFLLGAAEGVAKKAQENINRKTGWNIIREIYSPSYGFEKDPQECEEIIQIINRSSANVLIVGLGAPKQEKWILKYKDRLPNIKIFMALGATIDFEAGNINRAPVFFQKISMEWLYRLFVEPRRLWKRYLWEGPPFFWYIIKQKLGWYKNPFV